MVFPGKFRDHILADKMHVLSVSFLVDSLVRAGVRVRKLAPVRRSLEELYMEIHHAAAAPPVAGLV